MKAMIVLIAVLALAACGGETQSEAASFDRAECEEQLGGFVAALSEIDSRLDIGMTVGELGDHLGDAKVVYDRILLDEVDEECKKRAGTAASEAFDKYVSSHNRWRRCIFDQYDCELDDIETESPRTLD